MANTSQHSTDTSPAQPAEEALAYCRLHDASFALNLCDILDPFAAQDSALCATHLPGIAQRACEQSGLMRATRLYLGSYFCDRYFIAFANGAIDVLADWAREAGLPVTLVLPTFGQSSLKAGKNLVNRILDWHANDAGPIDELCVNDIGMARWACARPVRLVWGRLFNRALRDPRYQVFSDNPQALAIDGPEAARIAHEYGASLIEADPIAPDVSTQQLAGTLPVALHLPHCYISTGRLCPYAAQGKPVQRKFVPAASCQCQCQRQINVYETQDGNRSGEDTSATTCFTRHGRTVYFENPTCRIVGPQPARIVWTPDDFNCPQANWHDNATAWQPDPWQLQPWEANNWSPAPSGAYAFAESALPWE